MSQELHVEMISGFSNALSVICEQLIERGMLDRELLVADLFAAAQSPDALNPLWRNIMVGALATKLRRV
jgi:hypothetical protein